MSCGVRMALATHCSWLPSWSCSRQGWTQPRRRGVHRSRRAFPPVCFPGAMPGSPGLRTRRLLDVKPPCIPLAPGSPGAFFFNGLEGWMARQAHGHGRFIAFGDYMGTRSIPLRPRPPRDSDRTFQFDCAATGEWGGQIEQTRHSHDDPAGCCWRPSGGDGGVIEVM